MESPCRASCRWRSRFSSPCTRGSWRWAPTPAVATWRVCARASRPGRAGSGTAFACTPPSCLLPARRGWRPPGDRRRAGSSTRSRSAPAAATSTGSVVAFRRAADAGGAASRIIPRCSPRAAAPRWARPHPPARPRSNRAICAAPRGPMRGLLVSDLHYALKQFDWVQRVASGYDLVVVAGDSLDISSYVAVEAQIVVVSKYLRRMGGQTRLVASSGNHDLNARGADGEQVATWLAQGRLPEVLSDGDYL